MALFAIVATAAVSVLALGGPDAIDLINLKDPEDVGVFLTRQRSGPYNVAAFHPRSHRLDRNIQIPRIPNDTAITPGAIADAYAQATQRSIDLAYRETFNNPDHVITIPRVNKPPPHIRVTNRATAGNLADYPWATWEYDHPDRSQEIGNRDDIFKDPFPSTFPGPNGNMYGLPTAPDRLRSIWAPDGLAARDVKASRAPPSNSRPVFSSNQQQPGIMPRQRWARDFGQQ